jgi:hypothetical protein
MIINPYRFNPVVTPIPPQIDLKYWYKPEDATLVSGDISLLENAMSIGDDDLAQTIPSFRPTYIPPPYAASIELNQKPIINYNDNTYLESDGVSLPSFTNGFTYYMVIQPKSYPSALYKSILKVDASSNWSEGFGLYTFTSSGNLDCWVNQFDSQIASVSEMVIGKSYIVECYLSTNNTLELFTYTEIAGVVDIQSDIAVNTSGAPVMSGLTGININYGQGASQEYDSDMYMGEFLLYDQPLSNANRTAVKNYLSVKYDIPVV